MRLNIRLIDRAWRELSKSPLVALIGPLQGKIRRYITAGNIVHFSCWLICHRHYFLIWYLMRLLQISCAFSFCGFDTSSAYPIKQTIRHPASGHSHRLSMLARPPSVFAARSFICHNIERSCWAWNKLRERHSTNLPISDNECQQGWAKIC